MNLLTRTMTVTSAFMAVLSCSAAAKSSQKMDSVDPKSHQTVNQVRLTTLDREQLDRCIDNLIAGNEIVHVTIKGHRFVCDYARTKGSGNPLREQYGYHPEHSYFDARLSYIAAKDKRIDQTLEIRIRPNGDVDYIRFYQGFPSMRSETRLAWKLHDKLLKRKQWYGDRAIRNSCAFRLGRWNETLHLMGATAAVRLSQSFKYAKKSKEKARLSHWFSGLNGEPLALGGRASPILWAVRPVGKTLFHARKEPAKLTYQSCKRRCDATTRCKAWYFRPKEITKTGRPVNQRCVALSSVDALVPSNRYISQLKPGALVMSGAAQKIARPSFVHCMNVIEWPDGKNMEILGACKSSWPETNDPEMASQRKPDISSQSTKLGARNSTTAIPCDTPVLRPDGSRINRPECGGGRQSRGYLTGEPKDCDPRWNTCRSYEPKHEVEIIGEQC